DSGWEVRLAPHSAAAQKHPEASRWFEAQVPGTVQTDLLAAGMGERPYYRDNEARLQWIGLADWQYRPTLAVSPAPLRHEPVARLADVTLNGHHVLSADNMFRDWRVPAKKYLHAGSNPLTVTLHSPIARLQPWLLEQPYALPGEFDSAFGDEPEGKQTANY